MCKVDVAVELQSSLLSLIVIVVELDDALLSSIVITLLVLEVAALFSRLILLSVVVVELSL